MRSPLGVTLIIGFRPTCVNTEPILWCQWLPQRPGDLHMRAGEIRIRAGEEIRFTAAYLPDDLPSKRALDNYRVGAISHRGHPAGAPVPS